MARPRRRLVEGGTTQDNQLWGDFASRRRRWNDKGKSSVKKKARSYSQDS